MLGRARPAKIRSAGQVRPFPRPTAVFNLPPDGTGTKLAAALYFCSCCPVSGTAYSFFRKKIQLLSEITLTFDDVDLLELYGQNDIKINLLRKAFPDVSIVARGSTVKIDGPKGQSQAAKTILEKMARIVKQYTELSIQSVQELVGGDNPFEARAEGMGGVILHGREGQPIKARTKNQKRMIELCEDNDIVFAIGPAGTGKTYTAVALAVKALKAKVVKRIILTRPAVEAGENLGFLPGDLKEKVDPYLRPLYDALDDMIHPEKLQQFMTNRVIEVAPLAFMRGRTLDNSFIILDEAQNTTDMQIKMFLTRLGPNAKCIVTGDLTQIDLPHYQRSGLIRALHLLDNVPGIGVIHLGTEDVVRHRLVKEIIRAYDKDDEARKARKAAREAEKTGEEGAPEQP
jgi:phosphate starvation-inducible PhoH-like protein